MKFEFQINNKKPLFSMCISVSCLKFKSNGVSSVLSGISAREPCLSQCPLKQRYLVMVMALKVVMAIEAGLCPSGLLMKPGYF